MSKVKVTYGIALCRYNPNENNRTEIIMIRKRFSYYYFNFVYGLYKPTDVNYLRYLFNNMSNAEKIDILSMQFSTMWYRIWLNNPETRFDLYDIYKDFDKNITKKKVNMADICAVYIKKKNKFESVFKADGGKKLYSLIKDSANSDVMWEIPKGKINDNEMEVDGALREMTEETLINPDDISILHKVSPIIESHVENGIVYKNIYYLAKPIKKNSKNADEMNSISIDDVDIEVSVDIQNFGQISEVDQIKWISVNELKFLNMTNHNYTRLLKLFNNISKKFKYANKL